MFSLGYVLIALLVSPYCGILALPFSSRATTATTSAPVVKPRGFDIPISRNPGIGRRDKRGDVSGSIGLGNNADLLYTVPIELGDTATAVNLDTGSSDLWVVSDACHTNSCEESQVARYSMSALEPTGTDVQLLYGDSATGTFASGTVGLETATIAGVAMTGQNFAAINDTNNMIVQFGAAGIFGLGFPGGSKVQEAVVTQKIGPQTTTDNLIASTYTNGPLLPRIAMTGALEMPMFSITLQRNTIDIGGQGLLTIGKLPDGIDDSSLTWVPVRLYTADEGGLDPPTFAPDEVYPSRWEIDIDGVFLDGQRVPDSTIPANGVDSTRVSALIDTGNSLLRGPSDVVQNILSTVSSTYNPADSASVAAIPCAIPHTVAFQIGGKMFPVDPRDFIGQSKKDDSTTCLADNLVSTDPPSMGTLFRWSLGDPFLKSNLVAFHYGNLTHPSVDPPRIGFLSNVPANADDLLKQAVLDAQNNGGNFETTLHIAPTASAAAESQVTVFPTSVNILQTQTGATTTLSGPPAPATSPGANMDAKKTSSASAPSSRLCGIWVLAVPSLLSMFMFW